MAMIVEFLKKNWMAVAGVLIVIAVVMIFMSMKKEKYYDYEMTGCSTCSVGDAGVLDYEEMYQMPDDYYSDEDAEDDEIYEDDTFAGDDGAGDDAEDEIYEDDTFAGDEDMEEHAEDAEEYEMKFAEEVMDGLDQEEDDDDVDMLEIDALDAEEDAYSEL